MKAKIRLVVALAYRGSYLILKRRFYDRWEFISGSVNEDHIEERATAIIKEEVGLDCKVQRRGVAFEIVDKNEGNIIIPVFATVLSDRVTLNTGKYEEYKFISRDDLERYELVEGTIKAINLVVHRFSKVDKEQEREILQAHYSESEWVMDPNGYFLIKADKDKKEIQVAFCTPNNKIVKEVHGKTAKEIAYTILRENLVSRLDHAAYLGAELTKAEYSLKRKEKYIQDEGIKE